MPLSEAEAGSFRAWETPELLEDYTPKPDTLTTRGARVKPTVQALRKAQNLPREMSDKKVKQVIDEIQGIMGDSKPGTLEYGEKLKKAAKVLADAKKAAKKAAPTTPLSKADRLLIRKDELKTSIAGRREEAYQTLVSEHGGFVE